MRCQDQPWIVWTYPRGKRFVDPLALPVSAQTAPLHRSHVRLADAALGLGDRVLIVVRTPRGANPRFETSACKRSVTDCSDKIIAAIDLAMRRAIEAQAREQSTAMATTF